MREALAADRLTKAFGDVEAVSAISFQVARGELFGFLGPNGAGKTTTIQMLTGLARLPTYGADTLHGAVHGGHSLPLLRSIC